MINSFALDQNITENCYIDNFLTEKDKKKIKEYLQKTPKQKQVFCPFWLRGLCIFPPKICPHAHGFSDFEFIPPIERSESERVFHINTEKSLRFDGEKDKFPLYILLPSFQNEIINDGLYQISKDNPLYTQEELDKDYEKRFKIRDIFQKKQGLLFIEKLFSLSQQHQFFITRKFIDNEFRRIKLNKMNPKPPAIVYNSRFCFKGILLPPNLCSPTEVLLLRKDINLFDTIEMDQKLIFHLKSEYSQEKRREILLEYRENIPLNKAIICDQWRRGFCEFQAEECRNAHGIDDLDPRIYVEEDITKNSLGLKEIETLITEASIKKRENTNENNNKIDKNDIVLEEDEKNNESKTKEKEEEKIDKKNEINQVPKIIKLKIDARSYLHYFNYQKELISKGIITEEEQCSSVDEITYSKEKKLWLREIIQKHEAIKLINKFFEKSNNQPLKKKFLENMFEKIALKPPASLYSCGNYYEITVPIALKSKKQKIIFIIKTSLEEMSEKVQTKIKKVIEDLLKHKKKLSLSLITKAYYQNTSLSPTLIHFLKVKGVSFLEYLKELQDKKIVNIENEGILSLEQEEILKNIAILKEIEKFWLDNRNKAGFCKKNKLREFIEKNSKELTSLGNNEFDKILYEENIPIIHLQCGNFVINLKDFGQIVKQKKQNKNNILCEILKSKEEEGKKYKKSLNNTEIIKNPIDFEKNIIIIDDLKSFQTYKPIILAHNEYGVDLEGELSKGFIDLIQISINSAPNTIIFIFDIFSLKKCSFFNKIKRFFKNIMENEEKLKVFFDCRRDSFALHSEMSVHCVNVIDLACIDVFIEQLQLFSKEKQEKNGISEYLLSINRKKQPGLNEILKKYNAKHGENELKEYFKDKFEKENWQEYFQNRPLDQNFIQYSAKDVEDLVEISHKMIEKLKEVFTLELKLNVKEAVVVEFAKYISEKYIKIGCLV